LQVQVWRDNESLWTHAMIATPEWLDLPRQLRRGHHQPRTQAPGETLIAIDHFVRALMLKPDREKPYGGLGLALLQLNRPGDAEAALRAGHREVPDREGDAQQPGHGAPPAGRFEEAVPFLRRAVALNERNVVVRANLARALAGLGRYDEALAEFRSAAEEQPFAV